MLYDVFVISFFVIICIPYSLDGLMRSLAH